MLKEHPEYELLPSEYFRRQIYGCFWFERDTALSAIEQLGPDNVLYETDFPHPTSMSPGPASDGQRPDDYLREHFAGLDETTLRKILHDNAAQAVRPVVSLADAPLAAAVGPEAWYRRGWTPGRSAAGRLAVHGVRRVAFPAQASCPRCTGPDTAEHLLAPPGTLWGFTIQAFTPKSPYLAADGPAAPFGVGYVDLAARCSSRSRLAARPSELAHRDGDGARRRAVPRPDTGESRLTYAFGRRDGRTWR